MLVQVSIALAAHAAGRDLSLVAAAKANDAAAVHVLLQERRTDVNAPESDGATALHWAVYRNNAALVDMLLTAGANPNAANRYGATPLFLAAESASAAIVDRLLQAGANVNTTLAGGETILMTAARSGNLAAIKMLLSHGVAVNAAEETRGQTALMWAAAEGHAEVIAALCEAGADLTATSRPPAMPKPLSKRSGMGPGRADIFTPLMFAVRAGHVDAVRALVRAGADVNQTLPDGTGSLVLATMNAHYELATVLLQLGADPNASTGGWTPLHQIARTRTLNINQFPQPIPTGRIESLELAKQLLAHGADANARMTKRFDDGFRSMFNWLGATPYLVAAHGADAAMMRLLLANGANPLVSNQSGTTPLLAAAGIDMYAPNEDSGTNEEALEAMLITVAVGDNVNAVNVNGDTALHGAAYRGVNAMLQLLVDHGAQLDVRNKAGFTPLQIANGEQHALIVIQRRPESVALLRDLMIARGLKPEMKTDEEHYSFGVAVK
jgi:ankyrin repeat protein